MEILVGPVVELGKCLYVPFKRHCGYLCCYAKNVKILEDEVDSLKTQREDMNEKLDEESRLNRTPLPGVKKWIGSVDKAVVEAEIWSGQMKEEQRCLMGWCPNLRWRHRVGKKASKQIDQVQKLKEKGDRFGTIIARPRSPADVEKFRSGNKFVATTVMEQVMDALGDNNVRSIGIYGMGGIGKTTLVKNINNKLKGSGRFDMVIFVTVSQNQNMNVIQDQIAERLGMKRDNKDKTTTGINNSRANRLLEELMKLKNVLIILDDVWTELEVVELGLPSKEEHGGCKIIVTTRNIEVCRQMGMEKKFEVKPLSDKDAWDLYESKVGDVSKTLLEVGKKIVNKCAGCPLAIVTLGSTLAEEEDENRWLDALMRLTSPEPTQLDDIIPQVITSIKFSYDHLKDPNMKLCFLFCSLYPEDYDISLEDLKFLGIGEGFLGVNARVQLMAYIKRLKNCSLLLESRTKNYVRMHDVVRLTAQSIASKEGQGFIEKTQLGLTHWPRLDSEEECKRLSLIHNYRIKALPEDSSNFRQLRTLLLKDCSGITHIPDDFFHGMDALVNLDLSGICCLKRWPKSISLLTNLRSLLLGWYGTLSYGLDDLAKLKKLEVLVIHCKITIPVEFAELSNLKILDLCNVYLELIPANVISRLHNLEELYLNTRPNFDEEKGGCKGTDEIRSAARLVDVTALKRLTVLQVMVREEVLLIPNNGWGHELQEFEIVFGNNYLDFDLVESGNTLVLGKLPELVPEWVICLIQKVEHLRLEWRHDLKKVLYLDTVTTLKQMEISDCSTISQIASTEEEEKAPLSINVFGRLEKLQLVRLSNLEDIICQGPQFLNITESFFMNLRVLLVSHCCKLVTLLPPNLLQALPLLKILKVEHCMAMRHIFVTSTTTDQGSSSSRANNYDLESRNCLEHLVDLQLVDMPNLVRICDGLVPDGFLKNLKWVTIINCEKLAPDVFSQDLVHCTENIKEICLEKFSSYLSISPTASERLNITDQIEKKMETIFLRLDRPGSIHLFQNLTDLFIDECPTLKSICSFDSTFSTGCTSTSAYSIFPKLEDLTLQWLEKLDSIIWTGSNPLNIGSSSFKHLRDLEVSYCNSLRSLFSFLLAKHLPHLKYLKVESCERLEKLILISNGEEESTSAAGRILMTDIKDVLPQLRTLQLEDIPELTSVFSVETIFLQFPSLRTIRVSHCGKLKHLSLGPNSSPLLKAIWGTQEWLQALEVNMTMETKSRFKPFFFQNDASDLEELSEESDEFSKESE